ANGPRNRPTATVGRKSAASSAATQTLECVVSQTSTVSATNASQVPMPEAIDAMRSCRKAFDVPSSSTRLPRPSSTLGTLPRGSDRCLGDDAVERVGEDRVLLGGPDAHADGARGAEPARRAHDHALAEQRLEERPRVGADLGEDEVADGRADRLEALRAERLLDRRTVRDVLGPPPCQLGV